MTAERTYAANAAESILSATLAVAATTVSVVSTSTLPAVPFLAVIEPSSAANREVVRVSAKTATTLTVTRGYDSTTDVEHASGKPLRVTPVAATVNDLHDRVDATETQITTDIATHAGLANPHPNYLTPAEHAALTDASAFGYVVDEDNMVSDLATKVPTQQSVKAYVDAATPASTIIDTDSATTGIGASSTAEATVLTLTIPSGQPAAGDVYKVRAFGTSARSASGQVTVRWKLGATTVLESGGTVFTSSTGGTDVGWMLDGLVVFTGTAVELVQCTMQSADLDNETTWDGSVTGGYDLIGSGPATEDSGAGALNVVLTVQFADSSVQNHFDLEYATLERIAA